ncbi:MAG: class I SAM-dependent methyltransferase, partial [Planctomycetia bacterium]|nr:class I SAM-dependent methyltransferase [Planctomycetia bacterium]
MPQDASDDHDELFFSNYSVLDSQPERLATIATLRGLQPQDIERARVLELGCASGQNLIPLAERYPQSAFVGIDVSEQQIAAARQTAVELNLRNVDLRRQNLLDAGPELGTFDFIIAHGMYSWIDKPARDKLLAICRDHLAPHGVAYVSYNVYPGWHVHDMLRAMMFYEARGVQAVAEQTAKGRVLLEFLKASLVPEEAPYDAMIAAEL